MWRFNYARNVLGVLAVPSAVIGNVALSLREKRTKNCSYSTPSSSSSSFFFFFTHNNILLKGEREEGEERERERGGEREREGRERSQQIA